MIEQNYYQGFTKLCDRNPKMTRIPSKDELERVGCQISGMCYLITKDGMQCNPTVINPELFSDDLCALFTARPEPKIVYKTGGKDEFKEQPKGEPAADVKICSECNQSKPIDQFGKKVGRGGHRKDVCLQCEVKIRTKALEDITKPLTAYKNLGNALMSATDANTKYTESIHHQEKEVDHEARKEEKEPSTVDPIILNIDKDGYVPFNKVKQLVNEAYAKGRKDEKSNIIIHQPTLDDLLRA